ncbi:MAG TPA: Hsp20/alpha crystallin family protein [Candidatus Babeliales bacterium]|jgi:hypothetical protein|nr:Hsp20/alpha crystallin family protein [Candidatus Babeliales bacterium]
MKRFIKISLLGLVAALSASAMVEAKAMKQQQTVSTEEIQEQEQMQTPTTPKRMRLLPGAQRRAERRRGVQPQCRSGNCPNKQGSKQPAVYTQKQYSTSQSHIISHGGGASVNITSPHVSENQNNVVVTMNVGPVAAQDIAAEVADNNIYITGEYNRAGTQISINDSASLPGAVDVNGMKKSVSNGVLTITLPKMK